MGIHFQGQLNTAGIPFHILTAVQRVLAREI